jgi:glycosyltransferase involved in cell wall biosynthesis
VQFLAFGDERALREALPASVALTVGGSHGNAMRLGSLVGSTPPDRPDVVVAVDRGGLLVADKWRRRNAPRTPVVNFATESFLPPLFTGWRHWLLNKAEGIAARRAAIMLAPSAERAALHQRVFGTRADRFAVLPNAPRGRASFGVRADALAAHAGTDPARPHVLYAGSLTPPNRIGELVADAAANWPAEWVLVLHGRVAPDPAGQAALEHAASGARCTIRFSTTPVSPGRLAELCAGADVGVALYREDGPTFQTVGTAAGKVAQFLHAGLPVVTTPLESMRRILAEGGGVCADIRGGLREPIAALLARGLDARREAAACFDRHFDFDAAWAAVRPRLEALASGRVA